MGDLDIFVIKRTTFGCKKCKREWERLAGDRSYPPEACPFCKLAQIEGELKKEKLGHSMMSECTSPEGHGDFFLTTGDNDGFWGMIVVCGRCGNALHWEEVRVRLNKFAALKRIYRRIQEADHPILTLPVEMMAAMAEMTALLAEEG